MQAGQREQLLDQDRVIFGTGCVFMVRIKDGLPRDPQLKQADIDYQFAVNELQMANIEQSRVENSKSVIEEEEMRKQILMAIEKEYENNKRASE